MVLTDLYHYADVEIESKYSLEESVKRLKEVVMPRKGPYYGFPFSFLPKDGLFGTVSKNPMVIAYELVAFNNPAKPVFYGRFITRNDGKTVLKGEIRAMNFVVLAYIVFGIFFLLFFISGILEFLNGVWIALPIAGILLIFWWALYRGTYSFNKGLANKMLSVFEKTLQGDSV